MKVLDATYRIDDLAGTARAAEFSEDNGGADEFWVGRRRPPWKRLSALAFIRTVTSIALSNRSRGEVYPIDAALSFRAARLAEEIGPEGPYIDSIDALVRAVGRELDVPVISTDGDLTHPVTKRIIDVDEY